MGPETENKVTRMVWMDEYGQVQIDVSNPLDVTARIDMTDWSTDCSVGIKSWCATQTGSSMFEDWNSDGTIDAIRQWADARKKNEEKKEKEEVKSIAQGVNIFGVQGSYKEKEEVKSIAIKHVIFDGPATIVFWSDGTKTVVKCTDDDSYSYDVGIAMATLKKIFGESYSTYKHAVSDAISDAIDYEIKKKNRKKTLAKRDILGLEKIVEGLKKAYGIKDEKK